MKEAYKACKVCGRAIPVDGPDLCPECQRKVRLMQHALKEFLRDSEVVKLIRLIFKLQI